MRSNRGQWVPNNLKPAAPVGVLPLSLCTSYAESRMYPVISAQYHDNTIERGLIEDGVNLAISIRSWKISKRLAAPALVTLRQFFEEHQGGLIPFYFYDLFAANPGDPFGSNYDSNGTMVQGRLTVTFRGDWNESTDLARSNTAFDLILRA